MNGYTQTSYLEVLEGVRQARAWYEQVGISTTATRIEALEQVLVEFTHDLETRTAAEVVERWDWKNDQRAYYALSDGVGFANIHEGLRGLPSHQLPRSELKRALRGPLCPTEEEPTSAEGRNIFLELDLGAKLLKAGIEVTGWDDVQFVFDNIRYLVECKRPFGGPGVARNIGNAWDQIDRRAPRGSFIRGLIGLGVDKVFELDQERPQPVTGEADLQHRVVSLTEEFLREYRECWREAMDDRLVGVLVMFRFLCHTLPTNTISAVSYDVVLPTIAPETKDHARLRQLGERLQIQARVH